LSTEGEKRIKKKKESGLRGEGEPFTTPDCNSISQRIENTIPYSTRWKKGGTRKIIV